jgi:hypothetical protein
VTQTVMVAWGESMIRSCGGDEQQDPLRISIDADGNMNAGFASLRRARTLFETSSRLQKLLDIAGAGPNQESVEMSYKIKNVSLLKTM